MLIIGLLLVLVAAALTVGAVMDGGDPATVEIFSVSWDTTVAGVFFTGVATAAIFLLGAWLMKHTASRARKRRTERKELKHRQQDSVRGLEEERSSLRAENEKMAQELASRQAAARSAEASQSGNGAEGYTENRTPVSDQSRARDQSRAPDQS